MPVCLFVGLQAHALNFDSDVPQSIQNQMVQDLDFMNQLAGSGNQTPFHKQIFNEEVFIDTLESYKPDLLVLAGFLWKIPDYMIMAFPNKIINIHPALLPKYGGKGMYGHFVHEAVIANHEKESGITIHFVNEHYDEGTVLLQKSIPVSIDDVPEELAKKVLKLEHEWYAKVIESLLKSS